MPAPFEVVTDTNVIAFALLETQPFYAEVNRFWDRVTQAAAPVHRQAEMANVIWLAARHGPLSPAAVEEALRIAEMIPVAGVPILPLWRGAVRRSLDTGLAVYDTLFLELAAQNECRLVTFDAQVLHACPKLACRPRA